MKSTQIGVVTLMYDPEGVPVSAEFRPTIVTTMDEDIKQQLLEIPGTDLEAVKQRAGLMFGAFMHQFNTIELADRSEAQVVTEIDKCSRYPNGNPRWCTINVNFVTHTQNP